MDDELMTLKQLAEYLHVTPQTIYVWNCEGRGPAYFKAGKFLRYRTSDVMAWTVKNSRG